MLQLHRKVNLQYVTPISRRLSRIIDWNVLIFSKKQQSIKGFTTSST